MRFLFLFYFLWQFFFAVAQHSPANDVVYLNDGSRITGEITLYQPGQELTITTPTGLELKIPAKMITRVEIGGLPDVHAHGLKETIPRSSAGTGTRFYLMSTLLIPRDNGFIRSDVPGASLHVGAIERFDPRYGLGIMSGIDLYEPGMGRAIIPVYATGILNLAEESNSPFIRGGLGWGFPVTDRNSETFDNKGGIFAQIGLGMEFFSRGKSALHFEVAYMHQQTEFKYPGGWWPVGIIHENLNYRRLKLNLGFSF